MVAKRVEIGGKPSRIKADTVGNEADTWVTQAAVADAAVEEPAVPVEPMKRLTIDVSASLHSRIKVQCAQGGQKMADVIRELLEERFPSV